MTKINDYITFLLLSWVTCLASVNAFDLMESLGQKPTYIDPKDLDAAYSKKMKQGNPYFPGHVYGSFGVGTSWNNYRMERQQKVAYAQIPEKVDFNFNTGYQINQWIGIDLGYTKIHNYAMKVVKPNDNTLTQLTHQGKESMGTVSNQSFTHWAIRFDSHEQNYKPKLWMSLGFAHITQDRSESNVVHKEQGNTGYLALGYDSPVNDLFGVTSSLSYTAARKDMGANYLLSIGLYAQY